MRRDCRLSRERVEDDEEGDLVSSLSVDSYRLEKYLSIFYEAFITNDCNRFCCFGRFNIKLVNCA